MNSPHDIPDMDNKTPSVALFGGSFNPVHRLYHTPMALFTSDISPWLMQSVKRVLSTRFGSWCHLSTLSRKTTPTICYRRNNASSSHNSH